MSAAPGFGRIVMARGVGRGPTELAATLVAMQQGRGIDLGPVHTEIASATCEAEPVCALVVAVYAPQPW